MKQGTFLFISDYLIVEYDWQKRMPFFEMHTHSEAGEHTLDRLLNKIHFLFFQE